MLTSLRDRFTSDWRRVDWGRTALLILLILAVFAALWQYAMPQIRTITTTEFRRVNQIRTVEKVKRVLVPCPEQGIVVLDKQQVAKRLDMPELLTPLNPPLSKGDGPKGSSQEAGVEVTATADLPESRNGIETVSLIDLQTGESQIVAREKPAPWFQFRRDGAVGVRYGINQRLETAGTVYGRWDFLRVKDLYLSAYGDLATGGDAQLQLGVEYRW